MRKLATSVAAFTFGVGVALAVAAEPEVKPAPAAAKPASPAAEKAAAAPAAKPAAKGKAAAKPTSPPNTLTAKEKAAGWRLLFDGKTSKGWRGFRKGDFERPTTYEPQVEPADMVGEVDVEKVAAIFILGVNTHTIKPGRK